MRGTRRDRRKLLCTAATGPFAELVEVSLPTLEAYADRHRWELVICREDTARGRPPAWGKVPLLADLLDRHDVVMWIDGDAVIVDDSLDVLSELRWHRDLYLVEHTNAGITTANSGVMMLRAGDWTRRFLAAVWAQEDLIDHPWWENAAIMRLLGYRLAWPSATRGRATRWRLRTHYLDVAWNSLPHWHSSPAPRITHYASLPMEERRERMLADAHGAIESP
jgi:hypothetical protein